MGTVETHNPYYPVKRPAETRLSGTTSWGKMMPELNFEGTLVREQMKGRKCGVGIESSKIQRSQMQLIDYG